MTRHKSSRSTLKSGADVLHPVAPETFLRRYWQKKPLVVKGNANRLSEIHRILGSFDVPHLLSIVATELVTVLGPRPKHAAPELDSLPVTGYSPEALLWMYAQGSQLYISNVPGLEPICADLCSTLGVIPEQHVDLYATKPGGGVQWHFDKNDNFTIQLQGSKRWWFSEEGTVEQPLHNDTDYNEAYYDLRTAPPRPPRKKSHQTVLLEPGDVFYIPKGFWHRTHAETDSVSLDLNLTARSWGEHLSGALSTLLNYEASSRETPHLNPITIEAQLTRLRTAAAMLRADHFVLPPENGRLVLRGNSLLERNPCATWTPLSRSSDGVRIDISHPAQRVELEFSVPEVFDFLMALPAVGTECTVDALVSRSPLDKRNTTALLRELVRAGLFVRR